MSPLARISPSGERKTRKPRTSPSLKRTAMGDCEKAAGWKREKQSSVRAMNVLRRVFGINSKTVLVAERFLSSEPRQVNGTCGSSANAGGYARSAIFGLRSLRDARDSRMRRFAALNRRENLSRKVYAGNVGDWWRRFITVPSPVR